LIGDKLYNIWIEFIPPTVVEDLKMIQNLTILYEIRHSMCNIALSKVILQHLQISILLALVKSLDWQYQLFYMYTFVIYYKYVEPFFHMWADVFE